MIEVDNNRRNIPRIGPFIKSNLDMSTKTLSESFRSMREDNFQEAIRTLNKEWEMIKSQCNMVYVHHKYRLLDVLAMYHKSLNHLDLADGYVENGLNLTGNNISLNIVKRCILVPQEKYDEARVRI